MKLSKIEKRILTYILDQYPNAADWSEGDKLPLAKECPLATREMITAAHSTEPTEQVEAAIARLVTLRLVRDLYLYLDSEVSLVKGGAGKPMKLALAVRGNGPTAYQATEYGEKTRNDFWDKWLKKLGKDFAESMAKEHGAKLASAVGGFFLAVLLAWSGVDLRFWDAQKKEVGNPPAVNAKANEK